MFNAIDVAIMNKNMQSLELGRMFANVFDDYEISCLYPGEKLISFLSARFGLEKSSIYNYVSVYRRFYYLTEYHCYSFSKLVELLNVDDADLVYFSPHLTVKQIREIKKSLNDDDKFQTSGKIKSYKHSIYVDCSVIGIYKMLRSLGFNVRTDKKYKLTIVDDKEA